MADRRRRPWSQVDVEGAESDVLTSLPRAFWERVQQLVVEVHPETDAVVRKAIAEHTGLHVAQAGEQGPCVGGYLLHASKAS